MFSFFKSKVPFYHTDMHSHLIPGIDDGVDTWEESLTIIRKMNTLGVNKIITTPHIIHDYYPNTPKLIRSKVQQLNELLVKEDVAVTVEAGAEYYIDEYFTQSVGNNEPLLSFGDNYILVETAFMNKPIHLEGVLFDLQSKGYRPVLAHPERYAYFQQDYELMSPLLDRGILLQVNINSMIGYYSKAAQNLAEFLIKTQSVHFLGSDVHNLKHLDKFEEAIGSKNFERCRQLPLLNSTL